MSVRLTRDHSWTRGVEYERIAIVWSFAFS